MTPTGVLTAADRRVANLAGMPLSKSQRRVSSLPFERSRCVPRISTYRVVTSCPSIVKMRSPLSDAKYRTTPPRASAHVQLHVRPNRDGAIRHAFSSQRYRDSAGVLALPTGS